MTLPGLSWIPAFPNDFTKHPQIIKVSLGDSLLEGSSQSPARMQSFKKRVPSFGVFPLLANLNQLN